MSVSRRFATMAGLVVLLLASTAAMAQRKELADSTPEQRAEIQTELMKSMLDLSDEQVTEVSKIVLDSAKQAQPLLTGSEGDMTLMKKMKALGEQRDAALQKVLSADQYKKYQSSKKEIQQQLLDKLKSSEQ